METTKRRVTDYGGEDSVIYLAMDVLRERISCSDFSVVNDPESVKKFLVLKLAELQHEIFGIILLDVCNRVLKIETLFRGTLNHTSVYPREVLKIALESNAASIIFYHNHPSGLPDPSKEDIELTRVLGSILNFVDIKVVDHIIVARHKVVSFKESGMMPKFNEKI